jgi:hypothetical protein
MELIYFKSETEIMEFTDSNVNPTNVIREYDNIKNTKIKWKTLD